MRVGKRRAPASAVLVGALACTFAACGACDGVCSEGAATLSEHTSRRAKSPNVAWEEPITVDTGDAYKGRWRMNESRFHYVDDPTVELTRDGHAAVAWVDNRRQDVLFQRYDPDGRALFDDPVNVSKTPRIFSWLPQMGVAEDGRKVFVAWQEIVFSGGTHGGELFFARSTDGGRTFSRALNLSESEAGDGKGRLTKELWHNGSLELARGPGNTLYVAWTEYEGTLWFCRSTDGGQHFDDRVRVAGSDDKPARGPALAAGPDNSVYVAWTVGEHEGADIHLARSDDGGSAFGAPRALFASDGHADAPAIAVDEEGAVHVAYAESPAGMLESYHVRYARLTESGRVARTPVAIAGAHGDDVEAASFPTLELSPRGDVILLWERYPNADRRPRGLGLARSTDRGRSFSAPSLVRGTANAKLGPHGGLQGLLMDKLAVGKGGSLAVVNSRFDSGRASRIRLLRGRVE